MTPPPNMNPEQEARIEIDRQLEQSGWQIQDADQMNIFAAKGVAIREARLKKGHGQVDYLLFVDGKAVGVLEAKKLGFPLTVVEVQAQRYSDGLPDALDAPYRPLPFCYLSTGAVTKFTNLLDPHPLSRRVFQFHRPETLAEWLEAETLNEWVKGLHMEGGVVPQNVVRPRDVSRDDGEGDPADRALTLTCVADGSTSANRGRPAP
jgi:type I site-specific restriction endonuclease